MSGPVDYRQDLTVFVLSTGEDTISDCVQALERQTCRFRLERIHDVYPMNRAFQAMPDRCQTPYFVQVDADMLLYPHAIQTLYQGIRASGWTTSLVFGPLYEEGFGPGGAVKCWKRTPFRVFQFRDVRTVDRDLFRRMAWCGLHRRNLQQTLGLHRPRHSRLSEYVKSKSDVEKWRYLRRPVTWYALPLLETLITAYPTGRHRVLGMLVGALTAELRLSRSKDIRFERGLFDELVHRLDIVWDRADAAPLAAADAERLRRQFVDSYAARDRRPTAVQQALAGSIVAAFSRAGADPGAEQRLLELASR